MSKLIETICLPRSVTLLGRVFQVEMATRSHIEKETGSSTAVGAVNYFEKRILISSELPHDEMIITFFHECHHAISYITGFNQICGSDIFELSAETFGVGFYDVLCGLLRGWEVDQD